MKRFAAAMLAAVLFLSLCACGSPASLSREELYAEMTEMLEKRKEIPEDHLAVVDEDLRQKLRTYNDATEQLRAYYADWGTRIASYYDLRYILFDIAYEPERDRHSRVAYFYDTFSNRFAQDCLYPDASDRVRKDWWLSWFYKLDQGGSYSLWAIYMHQDFYVGEDTAKQVQDYFELIDHLTAELAT